MTTKRWRSWQNLRQMVSTSSSLIQSKLVENCWYLVPAPAKHKHAENTTTKQRTRLLRSRGKRVFHVLDNGREVFFSVVGGGPRCTCFGEIRSRHLLHPRCVLFGTQGSSTLLQRQTGPCRRCSLFGQQ